MAILTRSAPRGAALAASAEPGRASPAVPAGSRPDQHPLRHRSTADPTDPGGNRGSANHGPTPVPAPVPVLMRNFRRALLSRRDGARLTADGFSFTSPHTMELAEAVTAALLESGR